MSGDPSSWSSRGLSPDEGDEAEIRRIAERFGVEESVLEQALGRLGARV